MGQQGKNIDNLFKDELGSYAETPPPMAWDALEKRLDKTPPPPGAGLFSRKALYMVMVASLLLLSISVARKLYDTAPHAYAASGYADAITGKTNSGNGLKTNELGNNARPANNSTSKQIAQNNAVKNIPASQTTKNQDNHNKPSNQKTTIATKNCTHARSVPIYKRMAALHDQKTKGHTASTGAGIATNEIAANEPEQIYNGRTPADEKTGSEAKTDLDNPANETAADNKKTEPKEDKKQAPANKAPNKPQMPAKHHFFRFEAGIKAGYETGFNTGTTNKVVIAPYIQYNLTNKFAIMLQPAVKSGTLPTRSIGSAKSYYKQNNDSTNPAPTNPQAGFTVDGMSYTIWHYYYSQTHDSIVKNYTIGGSYTEYEVPILVKYNIGKGISVYGGINMVYTKLPGIHEHTNTISGISIKDSAISVVQAGITPPPAQFATSQVIKYSGTDISNYTNPYPTPAGSTMHIGYMFGFSYEYKKRWLIDGMMQQTPTTANVQGGYNINTALSSTYYRFTLGYKIIK